MIKGTPELIAGRREEIINACEELYQTMNFKDITLKEIGNVVPFSRPTIYNYFQTKEEIFLALFEREYDRWNEELRLILNSHDEMTNEELADAAGSLANRPQLLKLLAMNNYDMEKESRPELLAAFKKSYGGSLNLVRNLLEKFRPDLSAEEISRIIYIFFPFMFGIYPYTDVTEKQRTAMNDAGIEFQYQSVYDIVYKCLITLLKGIR
ncbi:MAG: TetR/AcrR family transcriptional regulator [Solobacterium sp.]|nr:TetR/AcrR family transcriptional regulator [Solobacterium sp.]